MCTRTNPENKAIAFNGSTNIKLTAKPAPINTNFCASPLYISFTMSSVDRAPRYLNTFFAKSAPGKAEIKPPISKEYASIQPVNIAAAAQSTSKNNNCKAVTLYIGGAFILDMVADGRQKLSCFWLPLPFEGAHYRYFDAANQHDIQASLLYMGQYPVQLIQTVVLKRQLSRAFSSMLDFYTSPYSL